jgi:hypothetical protein
MRSSMTGSSSFGLGHQEGLVEGGLAGDLEGDVLGIHRVLFAIVEIHFHIGDREAAVGAGGAGGLHAFFHRWHEHAVHVAAHQRLGEDHAAIGWQRFDAHPNLGELPGAAGLFLVAVFRFAAAADGRAVGNPRLDEFHIHVEAALEFLGDDLELQPALAGNNRLPDLRLEVKSKVGSSSRSAESPSPSLLRSDLDLATSAPRVLGAGNSTTGSVTWRRRSTACRRSGWRAVSPPRRCRRHAARAPARGWNH